MGFRLFGTFARRCFCEWYGGGERSPLYNRPRMNGGYAIFATSGYRRSYTMTADSLAPQKEFESPTFRLGGVCSIQLSYCDMAKFMIKPEETRT